MMCRRRPLHPILVFCLCLCLPALILAQCPLVQNPCRCFPSVLEPVSIVCENSVSLEDAIQAIAPARAIQIDSLTIRNTPIYRLPALAFQGLTIIRLVLSRNTMGDIDPRAFQGPLTESLLELDLRDNHLGRIPTRGIPRLRSLRKLYLDRNRISSMPSNVFAQYESRETLLKLDLSGNLITDAGLSVNPFSSLRNLEELSLEANSLTRIPSSALRVLRNNLKNLNLGLNNITNVGASQLEFPNLQSLSLEFNGISQIPSEAFRRIPNLLYLIRTDMFRGLQRLYSLDLHGNRLNRVDDYCWAQLPALRHMDISSNDLQTTTEYLPRNFSSNFRCNPWVCDEHLAWFRQWLRNNVDMEIDKPGCMSVCVAPASLPPNWPIRNPDPPFATTAPYVLPSVVPAYAPFWIISHMPGNSLSSQELFNKAVLFKTGSGMVPRCSALGIPPSTEISLYFQSSSTWRLWVPHNVRNTTISPILNRTINQVYVISEPQLSQNSIWSNAKTLEKGIDLNRVPGLQIQEDSWYLICTKNAIVNINNQSESCYHCTILKGEENIQT